MCIAFISNGLYTYWPQFEGLLERLEGYQQQITTKMESFGAKVINVGLVDSPVVAREKAQI
jgi:L-arabinose isomerase